MAIRLATEDFGTFLATGGGAGPAATAAAALKDLELIIAARVGTGAPRPIGRPLQG